MRQVSEPSCWRLGRAWESVDDAAVEDPALELAARPGAPQTAMI
ncbi:MAG TPA: hypothetical protein VGN28_07580 [Blastococcus sp.]|nr:hypothetical protein [Blastococcus sp.]